MALCLAAAVIQPVAAWAQDPGQHKIEGPDPLKAATPNVLGLVEQSVDSGNVATLEKAAGSVSATLNANVAFDKDRAELKPEAVIRLRSLVAELAKMPPAPLSVTGYTDDLGTHQHGVELSQRRARAVQQALESQLPGFAITATGLAEANPVAPNDSEENRARNRRVEISYTRPPGAATDPPSATPNRPGGPSETTVSGTLEGSGGNGDRYLIAVHPVRLLDDMAALTITLTQTRAPDPGRSISTQFLAAETDAVVSESEGTPTGVALIDHAAGIELRPSLAGDRTNQCFPQPQQALQATLVAKVDFTCWYAVPSSDQVDARVGTAGTVLNVPVR